MSASLNTLLVAVIFAILGFFLAFFLKRATNIILFGIFTYASLMALDYLGVSTDWPLFNKFVDLLSQLGKTILALIGGMLNSATFPALMCFLLGGFTGFLKKR
jgi:hypothetical protein